MKLVPVDAKRLTRVPVHQDRDELGDPGVRAQAAELGLGDFVFALLGLLLIVVGALVD